MPPISRRHFLAASIAAVSCSRGLAAVAPRDEGGVTVSSEGGIGVKFSNWESPWYLGEEIRRDSFTREHHELLGLIAPRACLLLGGAVATEAKIACRKVSSNTPGAFRDYNCGALGGTKSGAFATALFLQDARWVRSQTVSGVDTC